MTSRRCTTGLLLSLVSLAHVTHAVEITAFTEPYREIDVASPEMATLDRVLVEEGDHVRAGQIVAGLDERVIQAAMKVAKRAMSARGRLESAEADLRLKTERLQKLTDLQARRHATDEEVARARADQEISAAQVRSVEEELSLKEAEFARITAQLETRRIRSPIEGTVVEVFKEVGEFVSATEPVILRVVQLDPLRVVFSVPTATAATLAAGREVPLSVGRDTDLVAGIIEFVSPTVNPQSRTARVKVRIPNPNGQLQSGIRCRLRLDESLPTTTSAETMTLPTSTRRAR